MLQWLVLWRSVWALLSQTWYVPDETWQSVEVAHRVVWAQGHLTWESDEAIRSSLLSLPYILVFKVLSLLHLDYQLFVVVCPRLLAGLVTACGDWCLYRLVTVREGRRVAAWLLILTQTNWFLLYSGSRTLVNTTETSLLSLGLYLYPRPSFLLVVALSVMMRPTIAVAWAPLLLQYSFSLLRQGKVGRLVRNCLAPLGLLGLLVLLDSLFYGRLVVTPYNFFRVNILHNLGSFYGENPWYWYLTHCLVPVLGPLLLLLPLSLGSSWSSEPDMIKWPSLTSLCFLSCLSHKEMRFLQPVLPLLLYSAARQLARWLRPSSSCLVTALSLNLPLALYLSLLHQRGVVDTAVWLGRQSHISSVIFLTPCHSAPLYSHAHNAHITLDYLTCLPSLAGEEEGEGEVEEEYLDEAEIFYRDPAQLLREKYSGYQCVVIFDVLKPRLHLVLAEKGYSLENTFFHSHLPEGRIGGSVLVFCR